ncbi:hypothetical protein TNCT_255511 [Trichonephila clavata]|uniref:Uncharacterized protein n=1 Tax=Trichonephila clavata TaxID=2740835 RepID=A0A8X6FQP8_TRICU|nr:hypothetical protein TNCT_255511 [Trichonephila clavata]
MFSLGKLLLSYYKPVFSILWTNSLAAKLVLKVAMERPLASGIDSKSFLSITSVAYDHSEPIISTFSRQSWDLLDRHKP